MIILGNACIETIRQEYHKKVFDYQNECVSLVMVCGTITSMA